MPVELEDFEALSALLTLEDGSLAVTGNYLKVSIPPGRMRNEWVRVRITSVEETGTTGEIC